MFETKSLTTLKKSTVQEFDTEGWKRDRRYINDVTSQSLTGGETYQWQVVWYISLT